MFTADVKDYQGQSPLDTALDDCNKGCVDVAQYLMHLGYGDGKERVRLLHNASYNGKLDVVKELVEQHKVDPSECVLIDHPTITAVYTAYMASVMPVQ